MILVTSAHMVTHGLTAMAALQEARSISTCYFIVAFMSAVLWVHTYARLVCPSETVSLSACIYHAVCQSVHQSPYVMQAVSLSVIKKYFKLKHVTFL